MSLDIKSLGEPLNAVDIAQVEEKFGVLFPEEYKSFLLKHNGAKFEPNFFADSVVNFFYGIIEELDHYDLRIVWENLGVSQLCRYPFPEGYLPVGCDPGGNKICVCWKGERVGQIFFWDHEAIGTEDELSYLADSIEAFLQMLKEQD